MYRIFFPVMALMIVSGCSTNKDKPIESPRKDTTTGTTDILDKTGTTLDKTGKSIEKSGEVGRRTDDLLRR